MKNSRLFEILYLLIEKRALTAGELAERLEVSERTIYRDIDALSAAGIPVFTQKGQGGGIRLMDQFVLDKALLSQAQQDEILFALQATLATGGGAEEDTLSRLTALFRQNRFYEKRLFALIVSGYSGGDLIARQLISGLNMNKSFYLPPRFCMLETANDRGSLVKLPGIAQRGALFAGRIMGAS